ncbi:MAG: alpha/beta fold hydrolase [Candidatus Marsarchaeota archaeon]|nr:alpha/beta fold hydrolase [Candidatus Marsarchaeota archaeon]
MEKYNFKYQGNDYIYYMNSIDSQYALILLHGYSFNSDIWDNIGLSKLLYNKKIQMLAFDVPGFPKSRNNIKLDEGEIINIVKELTKGIQKKKILLGCSAGAYIAAKAAENNDNINALVLVGPVDIEKINFDMIKVPIFGIWGSEDKISDHEKGREILEKYNGEVKVIIGAGHACYINEPNKFNDIILDIFSSVFKYK